jgi:hypothetical protein
MLKRHTPSTKKIQSYENATCRDYLEQADICCEQARAAALKKRFVAALGLFRTAQSLYNRSLAMGGEACSDARERLQNLSGEIACYAELARPRHSLPQRAPIAIPQRDDVRI